MIFSLSLFSTFFFYYYYFLYKRQYTPMPMTVDTFYLIASSVAALIARSVTYPLDTIKTRLQTKSTHYDLLIDPTSQIDKRAMSLYRGMGITLLFSVPALTVYLVCYEWSKVYLDTLGLSKEVLLNHAISGSFAELAAGIFFTPMEVIKSQLQINPQSTWQLVQQMRHEGLASFYRGYWMSIAVFLPHSVTYFVVYEYLKHQSSDQTILVYLFCSAVASALGIIVSTPLDIVKTRWQVSRQEQAYRGGPVQIAYRMWCYEGGIRAFTRGTLVRIAWGIPLTTINMTVFEALLKLHQAN
ncbi:mitochondrial carrier domain-containing protein [Blakeslea trispora]|nr:mitochondrial carrier domain-containing protein [Blakeslea trispora]